MLKKIINLGEVAVGHKYRRDDIYASSDVFVQGGSFWLAYSTVNNYGFLFQNGIAIFEIQ